MNHKSRSKQNKGKRDPLLGTFASLHNNPRDAFSALKSKRSYKQAKQLLPRLAPYNIFPQMFGNYHADNWNSICVPFSLVSSRDWVQEFGWLVHSFTANSKSIADYLAQKRIFEAAYILGDYDHAGAALDQIENTHGYSFWLAESRFMLLQNSKGFEEHKRYLESLYKAVSSPVIGYLLYFLSKRQEPHIMPASFYNDLDRVMRDLRSSEKNQRLASIIEYICAPWRDQWTEQYQTMLHCCYRLTLIDRYNLSIKALSHAPEFNLDKPAGEQLHAMLTDIISCIDDPQIHRLYEKFFGTQPLTELDPINEQFLTAYDYLVTGKYSQAASAAESLLLEAPISLAPYWLLAQVKACDVDVKDPELIIHSQSYKILSALRNIIANRGDISVSILLLKAIAHSLGNCHLGISLWQFAEKESSGETSNEACCYSSVTNEIGIWATTCIGHNFDAPPPQNIPASLYEKHPCLQIYLQQNGCLPENITIDSGISDGFIRISLAHKAAKDEIYESVLTQISPLLASDPSNLKGYNCYLPQVVSLQFEALTALNRPDSAAREILKQYFDNKNLLRHIPFEQLIEGGKSGKWPMMQKSIYWPILVFLNNGDQQDLYEAVDDYMQLHGFSSLQELLDHIKTLPFNVFRVLLRDILVPKVLSRGALWCKSPGERRILRIRILQLLYAESIEDQGHVVRELSELEQSSVLEEAYRNVEGAKFVLDYQDENKRLGEFLCGMHEQYCAYRAFEETGGSLPNESTLLARAKGLNSPDSAPKQEANSSTNLLSGIVWTAFSTYIWDSDRGINATLGTRIRHGSLENQLKRVFTVNNILAAKDLAGKYQCPNTVLNLIKDCTQPVITSIIAAYIRFTEELQSIYQSLVSQLLRIHIPVSISTSLEQHGIPIKDSVTEDGLLDFSDLFDLAVLERITPEACMNIDLLLSSLESIFSEHVSRTFASVRLHLITTTSRDITNAISQLDDAIAKSIDDGHLRAILRTGILSAKDSFKHDMGIIQKWFSVASTIETGVDTVGRLITTAGRVVGYASSGKLGKMVAGIIDDDNIDSESGMALYEVLSILLRNIVQHSQVVQGQEVHYTYSVSEDARRTLSIINKMSNAKTCELAIEKATAKLDQPSDPRALERSPGGTGLARVRLLLDRISKNRIEIIASSGTEPDEFKITLRY